MQSLTASVNRRLTSSKRHGEPGLGSLPSLPMATKKNGVIHDMAAWVESLADMVGLKPKRPATSRRPTQRVPPEHPRGDVFEQRLQVVFESTQPSIARAVGGTLELVGLSEIRSALGVTWDMVRDRLRHIVETELQRHLGPSGLFRPYNASTYLICLFDLSEVEANSRVGLISRAIHDTVAKEFPFIRNRVRSEHFIGPLNGGALHNGDGKLIDRLFKYARAIKSEAGPKTVSRHTMVDRSRVLFSPCWKRSRNVVALNRCILDTKRVGSSGGLIRSRYASYEDAAADWDFLTLSRVVKTLYEQTHVGRTAPVLIPVQYETLGNARSFATYSSMLEAIRERYRPLIALQIVDIDVSHASQAILEVVQELSPLVRWTALTFDLSDHRFAECARPPVWALATDLSRQRSTDGSVYQRLCQLRATAFAAGLNTIARGVDSVGLAQVGTKAGITYMDGAAIQPLSHSPRTIGPVSAAPLGFSWGDFRKHSHI